VDVVPLLALFKDAGWEITEEQLMEIAADNASSNHWKDIIWEYVEAQKVIVDLLKPLHNQEGEKAPAPLKKSKNTTPPNEATI
jgi:hypothetical protein